MCEQIEIARKNTADEQLFNRWVMAGYERLGVSYAEFRAALDGNAGRAERRDNRTAQQISDAVEKQLDGLNFA